MPPYYTGFYPADGDTLSTSMVSLIALSVDACTYSLCGSSYTDIITPSDSSRHPGLLPAAGPFTPGHNVRVCVGGCRDNPDYCEPNEQRVCRGFYISIPEPYSFTIAPVDLNGDGRVVSNCDCQSIVIGAYDSDGIDTTTVQLQVIVNGVMNLYTAASEQIEFDYIADTLRIIYTPIPCFRNADNVSFTLLRADNIFGEPLTDRATGSFTIDLRPPVFSAPGPADGETVREGTVVVSITALDSLCLVGGTSYDSLTVVVDGIARPTLRGRLTDTLSAMSGGDTVRICAFASDYCADYCAPNTSSRCWTFYVTSGDIMVNLIEPVDLNDDGRVVSNCACQGIVWDIMHTQPLDTGSIQVQVRGTIYMLSSPELRLSGDSLIFTPSAPCFSDGDSINFTILYIADTLGQSLSQPVPAILLLTFHRLFFRAIHPLTARLSIPLGYRFS